MGNVRAKEGAQWSSAARGDNSMRGLLGDADHDGSSSEGGRGSQCRNIREGDAHAVLGGRERTRRSRDCDQQSTRPPCERGNQCCSSPTAAFLLAELLMRRHRRAAARWFVSVTGAVSLAARRTAQHVARAVVICVAFGQRNGARSAADAFLSTLFDQLTSHRAVAVRCRPVSTCN